MTGSVLGASRFGALRFGADRRRRLRSAIVLGSVLVVLVALSDAVTGQLLDPVERAPNIRLDLFITLVALAVALSRRIWRPLPEAAGLILACFVVNNTLLTIVVAPRSFGLALAYLTMTVVAAAILFPWGRRSHTAFLVGVAVLTGCYGAAVARIGLDVELRDLFVAVGGAILVSAVTHEVLLRLARAEHDQRMRVRETHAALRRNAVALQDREAQLAEAQAIGRIGSWEWNIVDGTVTWSEEQRRIFDVDEAFVPSFEAYLSLIHPDERLLAERLVASGLKTGRFEGDLRIVTPAGQERWMHARGLTHRDASGEPVRLSGITQDITERKVAEAELQRLALHDALTGLPNRTLFRDRLEQALVASRSRDGSGKGIAVAFVDLDDFKLVNDSVGHGAGDELLQIVGSRLADAARAPDTVARLGGDEFGILLLNVDGPAARTTCDRLLAALGQPVTIGGREFVVSASIGISGAPKAGTTADDLLRHADIAMYAAKASGKGRALKFQPKMARGIQERGILKDELRRAIRGHELFLVFQPQYELDGGTIVGVETLVRWRHPERGVVSPEVFIPLAEESGLIVELDSWVAWHACRQLQKWLAAGVPTVRVAMNASARSIEQPTFLAVIQNAITELALPPSLIEVEITESQLIGDGRQSTRAVAALRGMGVGIAIDDFGTGYSVLARLNEISFDTVKIDRRFISAVVSAGDPQPLLLAMLGMAQALGVRVVAEGIETTSQLEYLQTHGCDEGQGYLLSRPISHEAVAGLLRARAALGGGPTELEPIFPKPELVRTA